MRSVYDTCLMYTEKCIPCSSRSLGVQRVFVCLQMNDTMYTCIKAISDMKKNTSKKFDFKIAKFVKNGTNLKFNSATISRDIAATPSRKWSSSKSSTY